MNSPRTLSFHVTVWLAIAVAIGMGAYAVLEYLTTPDQTVAGLLLHHGWHVIALGALFYIVSWIAFDRLLVRPLNAIYLHLYAIGREKRSPMNLQSNVMEIRTIVEGINLMLRCHEQLGDSEPLRRAQIELAVLRQEVEEFEAGPPTEKAAMLERLKALEDSVQILIPVAPAGSRPA